MECLEFIKHSSNEGYTKNAAKAKEKMVINDIEQCSLWNANIFVACNCLRTRPFMGRAHETRTTPCFYYPYYL